AGRRDRAAARRSTAGGSGDGAPGDRSGQRNHAVPLRRWHRTSVLVRPRRVRGPIGPARRQGGLEAGRVGPVPGAGARRGRPGAARRRHLGRLPPPAGVGAVVIFANPDDVIGRFDGQDYLLDTGTASAIYLAITLGRPLLLEGEPGVGKTTAAKSLAA